MTAALVTFALLLGASLALNWHLAREVRFYELSTRESTDVPVERWPGFSMPVIKFITKEPFTTAPQAPTFNGKLAARGPVFSDQKVDWVKLETPVEVPVHSLEQLSQNHDPSTCEVCRTLDTSTPPTPERTKSEPSSA